MMKVEKPQKLLGKAVFLLIAISFLSFLIFPMVFFITNGMNIFKAVAHYQFDLLWLAINRSPIPPNTFSALLFSIIISTAFIAVLFFFGLRVKKVNLHGEARFAKDREIKKFTDAAKGIIIGMHKGKIMRFDTQQFVALGAPSRSGKGVSVVVPNLLDWQESLIVLDIKKEAFSITSKYRQKILGQKVYLFAPFQKGSSGYNPLDYVDFDSGLADIQLDAIANILYVSRDENDFFLLQGRKLFVGLCLFAHDLIQNVEQFSDMSFSLNTVMRFSVSVDGVPFADAYAKAKGAGILGDGTILRLDSFLALTDKTASSVKGTFEAPLNLYTSNIVAENTNYSDFSLTDVRKKKMSIYIGLSPAELVQGRALINLFFSQLILENTKKLPKQDSSLIHKCLLLMDEFTSLGQIEIIKKGAAFIAGYNLRLLTVFQGISQLEEVPPVGYGKEGARSLMTNHACQIVFAPKELPDAKEYSERLGTYGLDTQNRSRNNQGLNTNGSISESQQRMTLIVYSKAVKQRRF